MTLPEVCLALTLALVLCVPVQVSAAEYEIKPRIAANKDVVAKTMRGKIISIDYANRSAMISGYFFDFGPVESVARVKMLGSNFGSFELLEPGMKVEVSFWDVGTNNVVLEVRQLPQSADVDM